MAAMPRPTGNGAPAKPRSMAAMDELSLVPAREADRTYLAHLNFLTDTLGEEFGPLSAGFDTDFEYYLSQWQPSDGGIVAWVGNIPAGGLWLSWGTSTRHGYGHVAAGIPELAIAVERRFHGQGIGSALLRAGADLAQDLGAPGISLSVSDHNPRARQLYERLGFRPTGDNRDGHAVLVHYF